MVTVKFLLCNCPDLSQDFLDANHLSEYPSTTWHYKGYYKLDDYSYSVDDGDILDNWPETPEIEGYTKDGWGYIIYDPSTDVTTWYRIDPSTETIEPNDTHALFKGTDTATGNSVCYFTFVYSQTSSLPVITYKYGNEVLGTQVLGRFDSSLDDLQYPEEVGYDYVWDVPSTMPTTDTIIQATSRTLKTYNFTV